MIYLEPEKEAMLDRELGKTRIIWIAGIAWMIILIAIAYFLEFEQQQEVPYLEYIFGLLVFADLAVMYIMRRIRTKPSIIQSLMQSGFEDVLRNFKTLEIISMSLFISVAIYGLVAFIT